MSEKVISDLMFMGCFTAAGLFVASLVYRGFAKSHDGSYDLKKTKHMLEAKMLEHKQREQLEGPKNK